MNFRQAADGGQIGGRSLNDGGERGGRIIEPPYFNQRPPQRDPCGQVARMVRQAGAANPDSLIG